jgi:hypothetical protein
METKFWVLRVYHAEKSEQTQPLDIRLVSQSEENIKKYAEQFKLTEYWRKEKGFPVIQIYETPAIEIVPFGARVNIKNIFLDSYYPEGVVNSGDNFFLGEGEKKAVIIDFASKPPKIIVLKMGAGWV